jgi:carboxymethylenebutenolidase
MVGYTSAKPMLHLINAHGQTFGVHVARPKAKPRGCLIMLHEAFGLTPHMIRTCDEYAQLGFLVAAPALFALATGKPEGEILPQNQAGLDAGREIILATTLPQLTDTIATISQWAASEGLGSATLGYCWGGSCAYHGAATVPTIKACVAYYGGKLAELTAQAQPTCPTLIHLAEQDRYIPLSETMAAFAHYHPAAQVYAYQADHGFNRDDGKTYDAAAAALAKQRTQDLLDLVF